MNTIPMKLPACRRLGVSPLWLTLLGGLPSFAAHAAGAGTPNAGTILQQMQPVAPPSVPSRDIGLSVERPASSMPPSSKSFRVDRIEITGNTVIDTPTLHALVADSEGRDLTMPDLGELAARITDYYHAHGYPLARAIVPAQTMRSGVLRVDIIEARYGKVGIDNQSRVRDGLLQATLGGLQAGAVVTQAELDHSLLLLSDIPGLAVNATLKPGTAVGTSDLQVDVSSTPMAIGNMTVANNGDRYSGRVRVEATASLVDPLHHGDVLSVSGLSAGRGLNYGRISYDTLLNGKGTRVGGAWSALDYRLIGSLSPLGAHGNAQVGSLWAKQPLIRSRRLNLYWQIQYDHLKLNDDIDANGIANSRHLDNVTTSLFGDVRDGLLVGGVTTWNASWTYGHVGFDDAVAQANDAATTDTQGGYSRWNLGLARLQGLSANDALYVSVAGQWSSGNLDPSQQMIATGPNAVRAYDVNSVSGGTAYLFTIELRHTFARAWLGQWQAIAFFDGAHVRVNKTPLATGPNVANLGGAGVGLTWAGPWHINATATLAAPIGGRSALVSDVASARAWLQLSKGF